ncbi:hypothetical protein DOI81_22690 [Salmonella enterica subsp. enterica serovar Gaminara]|nr:hypothetical protein [Salmonella enterica subsp. enterica serovar Gaminara]ELZ4525184.1 hypothetical protein [Salmonella enterica]HEO9386927.1 hypothetical protein [Citrobacter freundii]
MIIKERDLVGIKLILNQSKISSSIVNFKLCIIESGKEIKHIKESNSFIYKNIITKQYRNKKTGEYVLSQEAKEILDELLSVFTNTKEICKITIQYFISRTDRTDSEKEELKSVAMEITDKVFESVKADDQTLILIIHQEVTKHLLKMDWWKDNEAKRIEALNRVEEIKEKIGGVYGEI